MAAIQQIFGHKSQINKISKLPLAITNRAQNFFARQGGGVAKPLIWNDDNAVWRKKSVQPPR